MKDIKIVIGSNFGDEGKGLMTHYFTTEAFTQNKNPIVVFHNGTAQRGHTVDYTKDFRHIFHHFGSGTIDGAPTYFTKTFWIHPMEYVREYLELARLGYNPKTYCDIDAPVITPFDMMVDHITEAWIAKQNGEREHGSCGFGSWCAIESRGYDSVYHVRDYLKDDNYLHYILQDTWNQCIAILLKRGIDIDNAPIYKDYLIPNSYKKKCLIENFIKDIKFFLHHTTLISFNSIYNAFDTIIFENGQGLGLDKDVKNNWHTTSKTGLANPYNLLYDKVDFNAEVCYISRSYLTRHGIGPMEEEAHKSEINQDMIDKTNVPNDFQGSLRYGYLEDKAQQLRINEDWNTVRADSRFKRTMAITHCNEFPDLYQKAEYYSNNPFTIVKRK